MISTFTFLLVFAAQWVAFAVMAFFIAVVISDIYDAAKGDVTACPRVFEANVLVALAAMFVWAFLLLVGHSV